MKRKFDLRGDLAPMRLVDDDEADGDVGVSSDDGRGGDAWDARGDDQLWDVPNLVRRARRVADQSQRDLAEVLGVSQSTVAKWETGVREPSLKRFRRLLEVARLWVRVLSAEAPPPGALSSGVASLAQGSPSVAHGCRPGGGYDVLPMRTDAVRDAARRRFPAHLDVWVRDGIGQPRWDRPYRDVFAPRRPRRDAFRRATGVVPEDHPSRLEVDCLREGWRRGRETIRAHQQAMRDQMLRAAGVPPMCEPSGECICPDECYVGGPQGDPKPCGMDCPCQCESLANIGRSTLGGVRR